MARARAAHNVAPEPPGADPRRPAVAQAVREGRVVRLNMETGRPREVHPDRLEIAPDGWALHDALTGETIPEARWGHVNIARRRFGAGEAGP